MTTEQYLERWRADDAITSEQAAVLSALVRKERFSVFLELYALLYLGVVLFAAGLGWTVREHFANLGDPAVIVSLAAVFAGCVYYCVTRAAPYSRALVPSPSFAFDYVLYLGCLVFAVELGYLQVRFQMLEVNWDAYLLASAALYFALAYRFDNRFVLSLGLSTLAAWFGVRFSYLGFFITRTPREVALAYGLVSGFGGLWTYRLRLKPHFLETYLHVAVNAILIALTSGAIGTESSGLWLLALLVVSAAAVERGIHFRRFAFVVYGVVYGYVGVSAQVVRSMRGDTAILSYFIVSGLAVVVGLVVISRKVGREE
jgi:hypothetical protein